MWKNVCVSFWRVPCSYLIKPECSKTNSEEEYLHVQFTLEGPRLCGQIIKQSSRFFRLMWDDLMKSRGEEWGGQPLEILSLKMRDNNQRQLWWSAVIKRRYIWRYILKRYQHSTCTSEGPVMNSTIFKWHGLCVDTDMLMIPLYRNTSWLGLVQTLEQLHLGFDVRGWHRFGSKSKTFYWNVTLEIQSSRESTIWICSASHCGNE